MPFLLNTTNQYSILLQMVIKQYQTNYILLYKIYTVYIMNSHLKHNTALNWIYITQCHSQCSIVPKIRNAIIKFQYVSAEILFALPILEISMLYEGLNSNSIEQEMKIQDSNRCSLHKHIENPIFNVFNNNIKSKFQHIFESILLTVILNCK